MAKVRVPISGTIGKSIRVNPDATVGATIGDNLKLPDGSIPSLTELANAISVAVSTDVSEIGDVDFRDLFGQISSSQIPTSLELYVGATVDHTDVSVASDGADITLSFEKEGGGDVRFWFTDGAFTLDADPATIVLTAGTDTAPVLNFIYVLQSTKLLTVSTSDWPTAEHAPIAEVLCQSAASAQTDGLYKVHSWTDHVHNVQGHLGGMNFWVRHQPATWHAGAILSIADGVGTFDIDTTVAEVLQLHLHNYPAFDTATGSEVLVVNDFATPYERVSDLTTILTDAAGGSMSGKYFNLVLWGVVSEDDGDSQLMINLPNDVYNNEASALSDIDDTASYVIPGAFKGTGFLIARITMRHQAAAGGTWTEVQTEDLRGLLPATTAGGSVAGLTKAEADTLYPSYDLTDEETAAGLTELDVDKTILPGWVTRYGGIADSGVTNNDSAFEKAFAAAEAGIGFVYVPGAPGYYGITVPVYHRDGVRLFGDGYLSHLRNTRTSSATAGDLRVVDFGNHTVSSMLAEDNYTLDNATEGDKLVTTTTAAEAGNFAVDDVIFIGSTALTGSVPEFQEINEVVSVDAGTGIVGLKYGLHISFTGGQKIYTTASGQTDPLGNVRRVVSRCVVSEMRLTSDGGDWWHAAGGCWESLFEKLHIDSRSPAVLNFFARSTMQTILSTFDDRAIEFAIGSHNSFFKDFDLTFSTTGKSTSGEPIISLNEGAYDIRVQNGFVNGSDHAGSRAARFITSRGNLIENVQFRLPNVSGSAMFDFSASAGYCQQNGIDRCLVYGDNTRFIQFDYGASVTGEENYVSGSEFHGTASDNAVVSVDGTNDGVFDCFFESGGYNVGANSVGFSMHRCRFKERHPSRTVSAAADLRDIVSGSTGDLRIVEQFKVNEVVNSTTPNNTVFTVTIPLDTLEIGDGIVVEVSGNVSGTNDAKEIRIEAESTDIASISLAAGESGAFLIKARLAVLFTTTTKRGIGQEESAAGSNTRRTSFSLNTVTNTMNVDLEAWVANAGDSITVDSYTVRPARIHELTP